MLIALPTMHVRVTAEAVACRSISIFARCVSGSTSVGLNARSS